MAESQGLYIGTTYGYEFSYAAMIICRWKGMRKSENVYIRPRFFRYSTGITTEENGIRLSVIPVYTGRYIPKMEALVHIGIGRVILMQNIPNESVAKISRSKAKCI
jgi:hypothetical protein